MSVEADVSVAAAVAVNCGRVTCVSAGVACDGSGVAGRDVSVGTFNAVTAGVAVEADMLVAGALAHAVSSTSPSKPNTTSRQALGVRPGTLSNRVLAVEERVSSLSLGGVIMEFSF